VRPRQTGSRAKRANNAPVPKDTTGEIHRAKRITRTRASEGAKNGINYAGGGINQEADNMRLKFERKKGRPKPFGRGVFYSAIWSPPEFGPQRRQGATFFDASGRRRADSPFLLLQSGERLFLFTPHSEGPCTTAGRRAAP